MSQLVKRELAVCWDMRFPEMARVGALGGAIVVGVFVDVTNQRMAVAIVAPAVSLIAAALLAILLIVFLVQNTHSTEISFLWMTTSTPLAVALLIAAVGSVLLTLIVGTARITQLRRLVRKNRT